LDYGQSPAAPDMEGNRSIVLDVFCSGYHVKNKFQKPNNTEVKDSA